MELRSRRRQRQIDEIVSRYKRSIPVKVVKLGRELGLEVRTTSRWNDQVSGGIVRKGNTYTIWTNKKHPIHRRRFTIAHEIGHFVLHRDFIGDGVHDDALFRSSLGGSLETEANKFAADLLMPKIAVFQEIAKGASTIEELAEIFQVSNAAMSIRLGVPV